MEKKFIIDGILPKTLELLLALPIKSVYALKTRLNNAKNNGIATSEFIITINRYEEYLKLIVAFVKVFGVKFQVSPKETIIELKQILDEKGIEYEE